MNKLDAFKILGLSGEITPEIIKCTYRRASMKYHPDRNPSGLEMMQLVNAAYQEIKDYNGKADISSDTAKYGENLCTALNNIINLGLDIEVCGAWIWVSGDTKTHKEILKENGFKWAPKKMRWYYRPNDYKSRAQGTWSMNKIREIYGSDAIKNEQRFLSTTFS